MNCITGDVEDTTVENAAESKPAPPEPNKKKAKDALSPEEQKKLDAENAKKAPKKNENTVRFTKNNLQKSAFLHTIVFSYV